MMKGWIFAMLAAFGFCGAVTLMLIDNGVSLEQINAVAGTALGLSLALGAVGVLSVLGGGD